MKIIDDDPQDRVPLMKNIDERDRFRSSKHEDLPPDRVRLNVTRPENWPGLRLIAEAYQAIDPDFAKALAYRVDAVSYAHGLLTKHATVPPLYCPSGCDPTNLPAKSGECGNCGDKMKAVPVWTGSKGVDLIFKERRRQVEGEHWGPEHDDEAWTGTMALAAACYAAPIALYKQQVSSIGFAFVDPWPWEQRFDRRTERPVPPNLPSTGCQLRIRELVKAGGLIAAEVDRLLRAEDEDLGARSGARLTSHADVYGECKCAQPVLEDREWCRWCEEWCEPDTDGCCPRCWGITETVDPQPGCLEHAHLLDRWCPACEEWARRWGWEQGEPFDCLYCGSPTFQSSDTATEGVDA
ncbi:hypothetical protein LCGC14_0736440 [marine sediment metagenome]|uniref:Uncharacterized protein n=1 Tax=marine sediment metagenome TaxID=412755 RepID=A0A0F9SSY7_9ZZZZ